MAKTFTSLRNIDYSCDALSFRAAATRCREKRKIWVQQLEKKADDLTNTNAHLQVGMPHTLYNMSMCMVTYNISFPARQDVVLVL